ncbi:MAG: hypothetical protein GY757_41270, partial [bacterium]|nr:hypothetical protein [bacterium]
MKYIRSILLIIFASFSVSACNSSSNIDLTKYDPAVMNRELIGKAAQTRDKLQNTPASWSTAVTLPNSPEMTVQTISHGSKKWVEIFNGQHFLCRIIMKDGLWYVTDLDKTHKIYKPYTATLKVINTYVFLRLSELHFLDFEVQGLTLRGLTKDTVTFHVPTSSEVKNSIDNFSRQVKGKSKPQKKLKQLKRRLHEGNTLFINRKHGFHPKLPSQHYTVERKKFKWYEKLPQNAFTTDAEKWQDCSGSILEGNLNDLLIISYNPVQRLNESKRDVDANLMNVKTGRYVRLPFKYGRAL